MSIQPETGAAAPSWPALVGAVLGSGADGPDAVEAGLRAAYDHTGAVGVQLIEWVRGRPSPMAGVGRSIRLALRPAAELTTVAGRPVVCTPVDGYRDLVATGEVGGAGFAEAEVEVVRAVATLLRHAAAIGRKDAAETLHRLSMEIVGSLDMDRVLLTIANAAARLVTSEVAGVFLSHDSGYADADGNPARELRMQCVVGHRTVETARLRIPSGRGIAGKVLASGRPERIDDYVTTTAITMDFLGTAIQEGTQSGLSVPMPDANGEIIGVLAVWRRRPSVYSDEDEALLVSLAGLAAIGLVNARLYQQQQGTSAELEARRGELERRLAVSDEALDIHRRLTEIAAEGLDLTALAEAVQGFLGGRVVIVPDGDRPPVQWPPGPAGGEVPRERDARPVRELLREGAEAPDGEVWVSVGIEAANVRHGQLYALLPAAPGPRDVITLEQSATICALLLGHEDSLQAATARLRSEFVWDLLEGRMSSETDEAGRALALGLRLAFPARIALLRARGLRALGRTEGWSAEEAERARTWLASRVGGAMSELTGQVVHVAHRDEHLVAILPAGAATGGGGGRSPAARAAEIATAALRRSPFPSLTIEAGLSRAAVDAESLPQALHEARVALSAVTPGSGPVVSFEDLGVLQFLIAPSGAADLHRYADGILGPLVEYDRRHGSDLVPTLDCYFEQGCNAARTARALNLHAKSLAYRLRRIAEIAELDLDDRQTRLDVELALRIIGPAADIRSRVGPAPGVS